MAPVKNQGKQRTPKYLCIILFFAMLTGYAAARAETLNFRNYTVKDGLANSTVYYIFQDSKGFVWFATESGVNRFDGHKFELFTMDNGLSDNEVLQIEEDSQGRIWFLTLNGRLCFFHNNRFSNPSNNSLLKKAVSPGSFISFYEDNDHNLWFGTNQNRLLRIDRSNNVNFYSSDKYSFSNCRAFHSGNQNILVLNKLFAFLFKGKTYSPLTSRYLPVSPKSFFFDKERQSTLFLSPEGLVEYQDNSFRLKSRLKDLSPSSAGSILLTDHQSLWIGTMGEGISIYKRMDQSPEQHLKGENITHLTKDKEGNIWVGTIGSGVYMLPFYTANTHHLTNRDGLSSNAITKVIKAGQRLVLGLRSGNLDIISRDGITHKTFNGTNTYNPVKHLYYDKNRNSIWYASDNRLLELHPKLGDINILDTHIAYAIKSFSFSRTGDLAVAHASGVYVRGKNGHVLPDSSLKRPCFLRRAFEVYYDSQNRLWFSNILGLQYYRDGCITELYKKFPVLKQRVTDIGELPDKTIVCSIYGFGVAVIQNDKLTARFTTANGLPSNICKKIFIEKNKAWIVTGKGLSLIDFSKKNVVNYTTEDGLISNEINDIYAENDTAYIATNNGLSIFTPVRYQQREPPPLYMKAIEINKKHFRYTGDFSLSHKQNSITVNFVALDYAHPAAVHYRYRLRHSSRWNETQSGTLEFGSLEPGDYHLEIKGKSLNTPWSEPIKMNFTIRPPFWRTWWFILITIGISVIGLFFVIKNYFKAKQAEEKKRLITKTKIISLEQQALQAMMNPHFIFNVMNSIQYFINTKDRTMANQALTGFARLIRKNLEICNKSYISIEEELNYLNLYLSLEKLRFGDKMKYTVSVDEEIDLQSTYLPSMLLQPYVENAIWHGIMPKDDDGNILIEIRKSNEYLRVIITDDGIGIDNSRLFKKGDHISRGMQLTMQRVELINKFKKRLIKIEVKQLLSGGTEVSISLPLQPFTN